MHFALVYDYSKPFNNFPLSQNTCDAIVEQPVRISIAQNVTEHLDPPSMLNLYHATHTERPYEPPLPSLAPSLELQTLGIKISQKPYIVWSLGPKP